jgi:glucosamine-6-phosphate deaminase
MKKKPASFEFEPASFVTFRDRKEIARVRAIKREDITRHWNPDYRIRVVPDVDVEFLWLNDIFHRIKTAMEEERPYVIITPESPAPLPASRLPAEPTSRELPVAAHVQHGRVRQ